MTKVSASEKAGASPGVAGKKADCTLTVYFSSDAQARNAAAIVEREAAFKKRGSAGVRIKNRALTIAVDADDLVAMRAMLNTYLRTLQVFEAASGAVAGR